ncbi:uncharacterized protein IL334_006308 [Kwoniella shivajii]|uniref:Uncharacterized protein n=1 Tax=Kwoniella shivajii TaxID=564305 RepID=A0ABZ1D5K4_9TREE|nr:hypothetical protein IL334_006308 [Kwoniella shivajii]
MSSCPLRPRRRPLSTESSGPSSTLPIEIPKFEARVTELGALTPNRISFIERLKVDHLEDTPSPLRDLEKGWKDTRRRRLEGDKRLMEARSQLPGGRPVSNTKGKGFKENNEYRSSSNQNNVRFTTFSTSAPLTPPTTPPHSPRCSSNLFPKNSDEVVIIPVPDQPIRTTIEIPQAAVRRPTTTLARLTPQQVSKPTIHPILAYPLPPTPRPVPLIQGKIDTIYILTSSSPFELILLLDGGKRIKILRGGRAIQTSTEAKKDGQRVLDLANTADWTKKDERDWENVRAIVERFKRITTNVKMYHSLGNLSITCSSPSDLILSFQVDSDPLSRISPKRTYETTFTGKRNVVGNGEIKVRLVYSRLISECRIDTTTVLRDRRHDEKLRTKRIVAVSQSLGRLHYAKLGRTDIEDVGIHLGLLSNFIDWREEEKEAVRRLWALKDEWQKLEVR